MLRFPEPTGGLSCEVKSDFDPLTSSIRKDHGDLLELRVDVVLCGWFFFGWFWLCRTLALIGLGWKEGQSLLQPQLFEIQKAVQTFTILYSVPAVWPPDDPTNGLISDKILCRTYSVRLLYREVSRHDSCFVSNSQRSRLKTAQLYVGLHLVVKSGNTLHKPTYKGYVICYIYVNMPDINTHGNINTITA